ncbi:MAG: LysM peptidoglycan-binding domain-containing protein [Bacteroidaceae bacterium]|nr:LysM peptidoglycan-binding domain-containing protein [Bacteroidaceae bacterium]MBP3833999.1 peptidoglycan DD-metalloendopeptidase family protein [Bacteroidaceae bacterium]MBQ9675088.1 peptidoglycan DD-metalloendopeptidase family protein [Bacteroidaceae bacterium]
MHIRLVKTIILAATCLCSMSVSAQDLIARQAPVDVKLKSVDSLALQKAIKAEQEEFPSLDIYQSWDNEFVNAYANAVIPETYTFDLTGFCMPTPNTKINDVFGYRPRRRRAHYGLDIKVNVGDTIRAAFDGKVRIVKNQGRRGYGKYIVIRHDNGLETVYGHLSKQIVKEDQLVRAGDVIGLGGNTGRSTGSHLHFETRFLGVAINPALMFDFEKQDVTADKYTHVFKKQPAKRTSRSAASTAAADGKGVYYKVKNGDTLSKIASKQGVSVNQLCKLNGITTKTVLRIGQVLRCS